MEKCFVFYLKKKKKEKTSEHHLLKDLPFWRSFVTKISFESTESRLLWWHSCFMPYPTFGSMWAYAPGVNINWYTCDKMGCIHFCAVASMCVFATDGNYAVALCLSLPVAITMEKNDINSNSSFFSVNFFLSKNSPFATGPVNKMAYWIRTKLI